MEGIYNFSIFYNYLQFFWLLNLHFSCLMIHSIYFNDPMGFECVPKYVINVTKNWKVIVEGYISLMWGTSNMPSCYTEFIHRHLSRLFSVIFKLITLWTVFCEKKFFWADFNGVSDTYLFEDTTLSSLQK